MNIIHDCTSSYRIAVYSGLKKFSKYLKASGLCEDHMSYVPRPKFVERQSTKDKRQIGYLTKPEAKKVISGEAKKDGRKKSRRWEVRDKLIILLFLNTGIRCSAMYRLDVSDIDLQRKTIKVLEKGEVYKEVDISDNVVELIKEWLVYRQIILDGTQKNALIISNRKDRANQQTIAKIVNDSAYKIDGKHITPHKLRATYGTELHNETGDVYFVQECMGHASPKTTELYIRGDKSRFTKKASGIMEDFVS